MLFAWFLATGCQWDVAQLVAWGNMFTTYVKDMTVGAAVERTFSGEMCPICRAVQKGKQDQERNGGKTPDAKTPGKLLDVYPLIAATRLPPPSSERQRFVATDLVALGQERASPPLPPPRAAV